MLKSKELVEIREHLEKAQNPLFLFDNDADGLCSAAILMRCLDRGKAVPIKSFPSLNQQYLRRVEEMNPDYIFILDKPQASNDFIQAVAEKNIPIVWIDHHDVPVSKEIREKVFYYNSSPTSEPVTFLCHSVFEREQDEWLAIIGCIADVYTPDFAKKFEKTFPELFNSKLDAFDALHKTEIGKLAMMFNLGLKDTTTNVVKLIRLLTASNSPYDLLEENKKTRQIHKRYAALVSLIEKTVKKAKEEENYILLEYSGQMSVSSEIASKLYFQNRHKDKMIFVCFRNETQGVINISIRGKGARKITGEIVREIGGASGGGHEEACGMRIPLSEFDKFKGLVGALLR